MLLVACNGSTEQPAESTPAAAGPWDRGVVLPAEPYMEGDPDKGWHTLLHAGYMHCGVPFKLWENELSAAVVQGALGVDPDGLVIPGREGRNAELPYSLNAFTTTDGVDVVNLNCLQCHGGFFNGELVIGLGNAALDFTGGTGGEEASMEVPESLLSAFGLNEAEIAQFQKVSQRFASIGPQTVMRTIGNNPAEMLAVLLMLRHDLETLAWLDDGQTNVTIRDKNGQPIDDAILTSDTPPWWRAHKKNALFYNGMARGDHRGSMMLATSVCVDTVEDAEAIDAYFVDMQAYVRTVRAPTYPFAIDQELAQAGKPVFLTNCAGCHGTYDADESKETYPNLLIPLDEIGTDPAVAEAGVIHAPELVAMYNNSFYGQITPFHPVDPATGTVGYVAPPLDGIWATAPFLHNGSVPTLAQLLDSKTRPAVWQRTDYDTRNFDETSIGWPHKALEIRQAEAPLEERKTIYDTGYWSQSNAGHTYGDGLSDTERKALIEYLKTL